MVSSEKFGYHRFLWGKGLQHRIPVTVKELTETHKYMTYFTPEFVDALVYEKIGDVEKLDEVRKEAIVAAKAYLLKCYGPGSELGQGFDVRLADDFEAFYAGYLCAKGIEE